ncbi:MAG: hypothetical protein CMI58_05415 [Parcubacteria group bacterium]|nr:hypothetical protein [Parcubacteria group bacterium]
MQEISKKDMKGFPKKLIPVILCQEDGENLISLGNEDFILNSSLKCSKCEREYHIKNGIFYIDSRDKDTLMEKEIEARDASAKGYDRRLSSRYYKEIPPTLKALEVNKDSKVIEYGCGTGRVTEHIFNKVDLILAIDFSPESLKILQRKAQNTDNIGLVCTDASTFKTKKSFFDRALSVQVLEHIPTKDRRNVSVLNAYDTLKNKGIFVLSCYHQDMRRKLNKKPQEGTHPSGIFFHYFTKGELSNLFKSFSKVKIKPIDITLPFEARLHLPSFLGGFISKVLEYIPFLNNFGHLLLVRAEKE